MRRHDDELTGTIYAVVDGLDGRAHHVRLCNLDAAGDAEPGSIVELRRFQDSRGKQRQALAVRSDLRLLRATASPAFTGSGSVLHPAGSP